LLYVGAPPTPLLRPRDDGPLELLTESYPYDAAFTLETRALWRGRLRGLVLRTPAREVDFIVDDAAWPAAGTVVAAAQEARRAVSQASDRLDATRRAPSPPAEQYVPYTVRRGDNLTLLARRFGTTPDVLRQLNQLTTDDIQAGQRLRVPKVAAADSSR
jgi:LysM repeat protein